jgi:plasmid stability protein
MAILQVKQVPDELYAALRARAAAEGMTISDVVLRMLRRELALPTMAEWLAELRTSPRRTDDVDVIALLDEIRDEH